MKKSIVLSTACGILLLLSGCTQQQVSVVAQQAGVASVAAWFYSSNVMPTDAQKQMAAGIVAVIEEAASDVVAGASYSVVIKPQVDAWVDANVPQGDQMMMKMGAGWVLMGLDSLFAMNPQFADEQAIVATAVVSYCQGVTMGLSMTKDSPIMKNLIPAAEARRALISD